MAVSYHPSTSTLEAENKLFRELQRAQPGTPAAQLRQKAHEGLTTQNVAPTAAAGRGSQPSYYVPPPLVGVPGLESTAREAAEPGVAGTLYHATMPSGEASAAAGAAGEKGIKAAAHGVETGVKAAVNAVKAPLEWTAALGKVLSNLLSGAFWLRIFKIIGGAVIVLLALWLLFSSIAPAAAGQVKGLAKR